MKKKYNISDYGDKKVSIREYVEYYLTKYRVLSCCDLTILIHYISNSDMPFREMQKNVSVALTLLKNKGKIVKVPTKMWKLVEKSDDEA